MGGARSLGRRTLVQLRAVLANWTDRSAFDVRQRESVFGLVNIES